MYTRKKGRMKSDFYTLGRILEGTYRYIKFMQYKVHTELRVHTVYTVHTVHTVHKYIQYIKYIRYVQYGQ